MRRGKATGGVLVTATAAVILWSVYAAEVRCQTPTKPAKNDTLRMIFPKDKSMLVDGEFEVICLGKAGPLDVEGESIAWEDFAEPLHVARVSLYRGANRLKIGKQTIDVFIPLDEDEPDGPKGWKIHRRHPIARKTRCAACHKTEEKSGVTTVGEALPNKACFECHETKEFTDNHDHPLTPTLECWKCHSLHDATEQPLLRAPAETLKFDDAK